MDIKEVSEKVGLSEKTIRYYEEVGVIPPIPRNQLGYRNFGEKEIDWLIFSKKMREAQVSIKVTAKYVKLFLSEENTESQRQSILEREAEKLRDKIQKLEQGLELLNDKIDYYNEMASLEKKLKKEYMNET